MDLLVDVMLLLVLVYSVYVGYKKGLFIMVMSPLRTLVCLLIAFWLCNEVSDTVVYPILRSIEQARAIPDIIASPVSVAIAFIVIFLALKFLIRRMLDLLNLIFGKGVFGLINRLGGAAFSICVAALILWCAAIIMESVIYTDPFVQSGMTASFGGGGYLYRILIAFNPIK